jgi:pyridoxine kinase
MHSELVAFFPREPPQTGGGWAQAPDIEYIEPAMAILSIQSHVVYGYAGNTSAVFPLQRLGHEVWALNTVEFSNHTGYGSWRGKTLGAELVCDLTDGLDTLGALSTCEAVLSGYLGEADTGHAIIRAIQKIKATRGATLYCCDPVLGDIGRGVYVKPGILETFRDELIPQATIITPNQFELGLLTGHDTMTPKGIRAALEAAHNMGPEVVLVTSFGQKEKYTGTTGMLVSCGDKRWQLTTPELQFKQIIAGAGDLTSAIFLGRYIETSDPRTSMEQTAAAVFGILKATHQNARAELCTITTQHEITTPSHTFQSTPC